MVKFSKQDIDKLINLLDFSKIEGNLIPVLTQDYKSNEILILAFANKEAISKSLETGYVHYFSRTRKELWKKGEESGYVQEIKRIITDCDKDSLLFMVKQIGGACHTGYYSCFYNEFINGELKIKGNKVFEPNKVYENKMC